MCNKKQSKEKTIKERTITEATYIIVTNSTLRETAKILNVSKSTVHKDVTERIWNVDKELAVAVRKILLKNKSERHIRGGMATKLKYLKKQQI